jgi:hypothetical protein
MLDLNSSQWKILTHAYGSAADIPALLEQLKTASPQKDGTVEPWYSLWSALCHQYDVYPASYAALPHIVAIAGFRPTRERLDHLLLAASIEAFRHFDDAPPMPGDLWEAYQEGLKQAAELTLECLGLDWQEAETRHLLGALAVMRGQPRLGLAIMELDQETECPNCLTTFITHGYDLFLSE